MADNKISAAAEKGKGFMKEFKEFALKGNVMDMAVGVLIGGAFSGIAHKRLYKPADLLYRRCGDRRNDKASVGEL